MDFKFREQGIELKCHRIFKIQMDFKFREQGIELSFDQFVILQVLRSNASIIQQDLANHLQRDKSIIVRQIEGLLEKELVKRLLNSDDKRKKNLVLTEKGSSLLNQIQKIGSEVTKNLLYGVSETEFEIFRKVLSKIQENGGSDEESDICLEKELK
jgi:DNA-binding MarR family transcriptional regulator